MKTDNPILSHVLVGKTIAQQVNAGQGLEVLLPGALSHLLATFGLQAGWVYLYDEFTQSLQLVAGYPSLAAPNGNGAFPDPELTYQAAVEGKVMTQSQMSDTMLSPDSLGKEPLSRAAVPLVSQDQVLGVIQLAGPQQRQFSSEERDHLWTIGGHIGMAIENTRIIARARAAERRAQFLAEISHLFHASHDVIRTLQQVLAKVSEQLGENNAVFLCEDDALRLVALHHPDLALAEQLRALYAERPPHPDESIVGRVATSGRPEISGQWAASGEPSGLAAAGHTAPAGFLAVPLVVGHCVIGVLSSISISPNRLFGPEDVQLAQEIAERAAVAIENARLYRELGERLRRQTLLYEASAALSAASSLAEILHHFSRHVRMALDVLGVGISLLAQRKDGIVPTYLYNGSAAPVALDETSGHVYRQVSDYLAAHPGSERELALAVRASDSGESAAERALLDAFGAQALLIAPLMRQGECLGLIEVYDSDKARRFSGEEIALVQALAHQSAIAIENVRLVESLQATHEELQESNRLKDEVVQNVSHELRTPLTFVKGYVELLQEGAFGPMTEEAGRAARVVHDKTNVIIRLVERIATLQHMNPQQLNLGEMDLNKAAREAAQRFAAAAEQASIVLDAQLAAAPICVMGDEARLTQVFDCLLENAIKFSPQGGRVALRVQRRPGLAWVEVQDSGIGIAADQLSKVWTPFYQVEGHMKRRFGGAGVGLAVVRRIVQAHGGHIWASSEPGQGCTFGFALRGLE
jgi:signal transduction histidine kinase